MRQIGHLTHTDEVLLACSEEEYRTLQLLQEVVNGAALTDMSLHGQGLVNRIKLDQEFTTVFNAIVMWMRVKDQAVTLHRLASAIEAELKIPAEPLTAPPLVDPILVKP